mmetsp:Transcript_5399/g.5526  ORF Transcript_5399/g.5526 Transcript_5399/m.5526 type:complete len:159 (-) Transcript_5399:81-557(-)
MNNYEFNINSVRAQTLPDPIGFSVSYAESVDHRSKISDISKVKVNKAKEVATGQLKQIFMTLLSFYFVGGNMSIFTIFFIGMYGYNSLNAILNVQNVFKPFENQTYSILQYKLLYVTINIVVFGFVIYRINNMGLLPLSPSDWVNFLDSGLGERTVIN